MFDQPAPEAKEALRGLVRMLHLSTNNTFHPLNSNYDPDAFAAMVNGNELAVNHYQSLHNPWMNYGEW